MKDELYIDNKHVDLGSNNITLNYKSNLLTDISKIISNNSYTIKLPMTANNMAIIDCSNIPSSTSLYPYLYHAGRLLRDGIEIVRDANVVLFTVNDSIEIALSWGNVTEFASVVNDGKKLTELSHGATENEDWVVWKNWGSNSERFPRVNYGFKNGESNAWYYPVVTVEWILDKIIADNNISLDIPEDRMDVIDKMIVPLIGKNDSQALYDRYPVSCKVDSVNYPNPIGGIVFTQSVGINIKFNGDDTLTRYGEFTSYYYTDELYGYETIGYKFAYDSDTMKMKLSIALSFTTKIAPDKKGIYLQVLLDNSIIKRVDPTTCNVNGNQASVTFNMNDSFAVKGGQTVFIILYIGEWLEDVRLFPGSDISFTLSQRGEIYFGEKFPFVPNLPDIKQIDFIKAITSMLGLFVLPDGKGGIKFIAFDDLKANISKAINWTEKVVKAYTGPIPRQMKYALDSMAQNNRFLYKEDESVIGNYDGNIQINNKTLDYERNAITLPFSASDTDNGVASISVYSYDENGELQTAKVNPRILLLNDTNGVFNGLEWDTLISNYYQTYKGMVNNAKVITEYIHIDSVELRDIEMDVPRYLGQYGAYFAIIEIKTMENDMCECKLLKMEV
ncbi:hypothetical protein [Bacteroides nordii]|jgi:hypothetical protein|uniref:hypothetical protein n=1 Tax=Bacteroides nordii TaxID=291645 RepID=UPI00205F38B0|nr:hypothetical protein [Bacteroides nordii]DAZ20208.1 MAG TPA: hypothetical protein [Caudoviricetes sp.]